MGANLIRRVPTLIWRVLALAAAGGTVAVFATHWTRWEGASAQQATDDAYLQSELTAISAKVPGYVRSVEVQDYERVRAGQVIVQLVDDDYRAAVEQAQA